MTLDSLLAVEMVIGIVYCMCLLSITSEGTLFPDKFNTQIKGTSEMINPVGTWLGYVRLLMTIT